MYSREQVEKIGKITTRHNGWYASFFALDNEWGYKFFTEPMWRDATYNAQSIAYEKHLGPKLGMKLDSNLGYGYITQVVWPLAPKHGLYLGPEIQEKLDGLEDKLRFLFGTRFFDMGSSNAGWLDDKLVCIDFSPVIK